MSSANVPDASPPAGAGPDAASPDASGPDAASPDASGPDVASPDAASPGKKKSRKKKRRAGSGSENADKAEPSAAAQAAPAPAAEQPTSGSDGPLLVTVTQPPEAIPVALPSADRARTVGFTDEVRRSPPGTPQNEIDSNLSVSQGPGGTTDLLSVPRLLTKQDLPQSPDARKARRAGSVVSRLSFAESVAPARKPSDSGREAQNVNRVLRVGAEHNTGSGFPNNFLKTSHYTALNFLFLNLYEQFHQISNCYFLLNMVIALIPGVSPITPITAVLPLILVLCVAALKDGYEDWKRHVSDSKDNSAPVTILVDGQWKTVPSMDVRVGDVVRLSRGDVVKADLVVLSSDDEDGVVYIETSQLDGETNVKPRKGRPETLGLRDPDDLASCDIEMTVDTPNDKLYRWQGVLKDADGDTALGVKQTIWRGSSIRKTRWANAAVIYTGPDTKQGMNLKAKGRKMSGLVHKLNALILIIFAIKHFFVFLLCGLSVWWADNSKEHWYVSHWVDKYSGVSRFLLNYLTYFILFSFLIPISLFITIEICKAMQIVLMRWDSSMFHVMKAADGQLFTCRPKTSDLNEQLAAVRYIFSDKTGTLTENIMEFMEGMVGSSLRDARGDREWVAHCEGVTTGCKGLIDASTRGRPASAVFNGNVSSTANGVEDDVARYLACLALCHTVVPFQEPSGEWVFEGASPDEVALVRAAHENNFSLQKRTSKEVHINVKGHKHVYEIVEELEFTPTRKMMSIVLRDAGGLTFMLAKGADSSVLAALKQGTGGVGGDLSQADLVTVEHRLKQYSTRGLRTLCFGWRPLLPSEFEPWHAAYKVMQCSMDKTDAVTDEACSSLEKDLMLTGICAYEDKLQDGVPETIRFFVDAGVVVWMLTGDKLETGIEIGKSCGLSGLGPSTHRVRVHKGQIGASCRMVPLRTSGEQLRISTVTPGSPAVEAGLRAGMAVLRVGHTPVKTEADFAEAIETAPPEVDIDVQERPDEVAEVVEVHINAELSQDSSLRDDSSLSAAQREARRSRQRALLRAKMERTIAMCKSGHRVAMAIDGVSLDIALGEELLQTFVTLAKVIYSGICCRLTPVQKGKIVELFQKESGETALAIGDGANDATMIGVAKVGIGIIGLEGSQAELASDYAVPRFRHLRRLVAVHGRYALYRNAKCVCFSFYKNLVLTMGQVYFAAYSGFTGRTVYDSWLLAVKNTIFTFFPPLLMGCFEKDISEEVLEDPVSGPQLFAELSTGKYFDTRTILLWFGDAFLHGTLLFWFAFPIMQTEDVDPEGGKLVGLYSTGTLLMSGVVFCCCAKAVVHFRNFDVIQFAGIAVSVSFYVLFIAVYSLLPEVSIFGSPTETHFYQLAHGLFADPKYWLYSVLGSIGIISSIDFAVLAAQRIHRPSLRDLWQEAFHYRDRTPRPVCCCSFGRGVKVGPADAQNGDVEQDKQS
eukprot:TRINITY_DN12214_c0_g3_i1.p1 TRINITY_DN12214_c0_g3~~TRINITY_DN12214_c0_g3_i1.p1  ORF type:complete len:1437 (+),score=354.71 TRINITY_DN12214_c0_g3_i1:90-4400(+)